MVLLAISHVHQTRPLALASDLVLAGFLSLGSIALFAYLGRPGAITKGRLYVSVGLYLLIGLDCDVLYGIIDILQPGSFAEAGVVISGRILPSKVLYFSLTSLTTLGYGDTVAIRPAARMLQSWRPPRAFSTSPLRLPAWWPPIRCRIEDNRCL